jgi:DNA ligase-1
MSSFKVMKAATGKEGDFRFPAIASPKVDGFRGYVLNGRLNARSGKGVANVATDKFFSHPACEGLDGELVKGSPVAKDCFQSTTVAMRTERGDPQVTWLVFDAIGEGGFEERLARLDVLLAQLPEQFAGRIVKLEQRRVNSLAELLAFEEVCLAMGFEGVMVRSPNGRYKQGRSTVGEAGLLKLKRFSDAEAIVIGKQEEMDSTKQGKGTLGALICRDVKSGVEFCIGTGFSAKQRAELWTAKIAGEIVKYKFFAIGVVTAPRHPVFLGFRAAVDL